jgi:CheY-like chemotaxis protein
MDNPLALIIEDDRDIVALFRQVLDMAGYHTEIVMHGGEAMKRIEALLPDIVLLDLQLPGMSGIEILKRMKEAENLSAIPVVVVTANSLSQGLFPEPDLLLQKPVDIEQLSSLVQRLKATSAVLHRSVLDDITGLHSLSFFDVRLTFSLERTRHSGFSAFGVLFAEVINQDRYRKNAKQKDYVLFQRKLADEFKQTLRPTDTMSWAADEGYFLALIEEIPTDDIPLKITQRVDEGLNEYFKVQFPAANLHARLGVLICGSEYDNIDEIKRDIDSARRLLREEKYPSPKIFTRNMFSG